MNRWRLHIVILVVFFACQSELCSGDHVQTSHTIAEQVRNVVQSGKSSPHSIDADQIAKDVLGDQDLSAGTKSSLVGAIEDLRNGLTSDAGISTLNAFQQVGEFDDDGDVSEVRFTYDWPVSSTASNSYTVSGPGDSTGGDPQPNPNATTQMTTIQLPTFNFTTVTTTVDVPDGGTVLLGGIKRLSEGRNQRGVPILNKIPYISRLFKNVGIGRESESLQMMVTPRIIIMEEEETGGGGSRSSDSGAQSGKGEAGSKSTNEGDNQNRPSTGTGTSNTGTQGQTGNVTDLLRQLRKLQDLQVTIEVRFITLNDNFFERIGIDFDFDVDDNTDNTPNAGGDQTAGGKTTQGGDDQGGNRDSENQTSGNTFGALDIPFGEDSFGSGVPEFESFNPNAGIQTGLAILSDIETYFLLQAAQGDERNNLQFAPNVTLFNGQVAGLGNKSQQPFVTGVNPVGDDVMNQNAGIGGGGGDGGLGGGFGGGQGGGGQGGGDGGSTSTGGGGGADFNTLIELIKSTIPPEEWDEADDPNTDSQIEPTLNLVVRQTQEVHQQIIDLLSQLRQLQDLQVTIEVRFISVTDRFFERIGVDFDFDIDDSPGQPTTNDGEQVAEGESDDKKTNTNDGPAGGTIGTTPGNWNGDLDIPFRQGSFDLGVPDFGNFNSDAGIQVGMAILSDIEAFFFVQAAQGDERNNIMFAPKITLFNGQVATVSDQTQRPFVTSLIPVVGDVAVTSDPTATSEDDEEDVGAGGGGFGGGGGQTISDFDQLMALIASTISPDSWGEVDNSRPFSGIGSTLNLVLLQNQTVHQEIADLLEQLRRLQDLQVTVDVRFINVADRFFERIGIDFDFDIDDNVATVPGQDTNTGQTNTNTTGAGENKDEKADGDNEGPDSQPGDTGNNRPIVGIPNPNTFAIDLDIPFGQGSFDNGVPDFGNFNPDAGIQVGLAILSDIEAFLFIQAAQGDERNNLLFAPKVTLFNNPTAFVNNQTQQPFVTSLTPVVSGFAVGFQPQIRMVPEGVKLNVQAVISADRRFVRLAVNPQFTNLIDAFRFSLESDRTDDFGNPVSPAPINFIGGVYSSNDGFKVGERKPEGIFPAMVVPKIQSNAGNYELSATIDDRFAISRGSWGQNGDDQWGLRRIGLTPDLHERIVEASGDQSEPIVVAVIDSGADLSHPELWGQLWRNPREIPFNQRDDDRNGYVDDVYGYNTYANNANIWDDNGHGTHVAGVIGARWDSRGIAGINPNCRLMILKAFDEDGRSDAVRVALAIQYAVRNGARIIHISAENDQPLELEQAMVDWARQNGALIVAASGSKSRNTAGISPASLQGVLTVGAVNQNDSRAKFSGWGYHVDLTAPGVDILSLRANKTDLLAALDHENQATGTGDAVVEERWYRADGTSFSAPFVTGVASLLWAKNPNYTADQIRNQLLMSCDDVEQPGWDILTGVGRLNAAKAMNTDPDHYLQTNFAGVSLKRTANGPTIELTGTADGSHFSSRLIQIAYGREPAEDSWTTIQTSRQTVVDDVLGVVPGERFNQRGVWSIRSVIRDSFGTTRSAMAAVNFN